MAVPSTVANVDSADPITATPQQCIRMWLDLMGTCEQFLLAGLRREIGPEGDLVAAYRRWYAEQMEEHYRTMIHLMEESARRHNAAFARAKGDETHAS